MDRYEFRTIYYVDMLDSRHIVNIYLRVLEGEWELVAKNIDHEFWLMQNLRPYTNYEFRLAAMNRIGWGPVGPASPVVRTHFPGTIKYYQYYVT